MRGRSAAVRNAGVAGQATATAARIPQTARLALRDRSIFVGAAGDKMDNMVTIVVAQDWNAAPGERIVA